MRRTYVILLFLLLILCLKAKAFHIVGGEIEFIYLGEGIYRINLIQYFDEAQNLNPGPDPSVTVYIFRNSDNELLSVHTLLFDTEELVEYTNIECSREDLQTSRILYTADVSLDPSSYADPLGYYIQWERCCRNSVIDNIVTPDGTGMNYVIEIPPLMRNGIIFQNSSPILFKPLSDYACINQLYYTEFTGIDPDGDSLVYSLTTPLNSSSQVALPVAQPKPHLNVAFNPGFSENNMVPGSPPLRIDSEGLLTVRPSEKGLFVFGIKVEEYRDGEKIGEVRRDFQMLVIDECEPPDPPVVAIEIPGQPDFDPEVDTLTYTVAEAKCFDFLVSNITPGERIFLKAEGVNFDEDINEIFSFRDSLSLSGSDLTVEICIPDCPPLRDVPFILDLIAGDDACPLPQLDTVRLTLQVQPPPNQKPVPSLKRLTVIQDEDNNPVFSRIITASDADNEALEFSLSIEEAEDPALFGFDFNVISSNLGFIEGEFIWDTDCTIYDFSEDDEFNLKVLVNDSDQCDAPGDTIDINARVILPDNTNPNVTVSSVLPNSIDLGSTLDFDVVVDDADGDDLSLQFVGANFNPEFYGVQFEGATGNNSIESPFRWDLACDASLYEDGQEFELWFIGDDDDRCELKNFDTLKHILTVNYPSNTVPAFQSIDRLQSIRVNEFVRIPLGAFDTDGDRIRLEFDPSFRQPTSASLSFEPSEGQGQTTSFIEWQPECSLLRFGETSSLQDVVFSVTDDACPIPSSDTLKITFEIVDNGERQEQFLPPNVFTPNNDGLNDNFQLSGNANINQNLPPDNCDNFFEYIVINNRAGVSVFRSENRDFVWSGGGFPAGVYYYLIKYSNTDFKGYIHLIR
ncbi:MAG: gliding motility-associated C-terminal domain-containing protein [Bacteroidota bacterium]